VDFSEVRKRCIEWRRRHGMFNQDIRKIETTIEKHISNYSDHMVMYRQTHKRSYLERAELEVKEIEKLINLVEKIELISLLSRG
jgi:hypothetical protein